MALAVAPLVRLLVLCRAPGRIVAALILATAPFLVLYPLGFDWGRWLSIQATVFAVLVLGMIHRGTLKPRVAIGSSELTVWLALAVTTGINLSLFLAPFGFLGFPTWFHLQ